MLTEDNSEYSLCSTEHVDDCSITPFGGGTLMVNCDIAVVVSGALESYGIKTALSGAQFAVSAPDA